MTKRSTHYHLIERAAVPERDAERQPEGKECGR